MTFSRNLGLVAALGTCWLAGAACSDDTTAGSPGADAAIEAGAGGSGGGAGNGSGGKVAAGGGTAGTGGAPSGGKGGSGTGGAGGKGGTSGAGGAATGGKGGADASTPDATTDGGGAPSTTRDASVKDGAGPDAPGAGHEAEAAVQVAKQCAYACQTDDDCMVGEDATQTCDPVKKRCVNALEACRTNDDCLGFANIFWFPQCTSDDDCLPGDICIDAGGYGLCATPPDPDPDVGCTLPDTVPIERHRFETDDAGTITVCGSTAGRCTSGRCNIGCTSMETFCTDPGTFGRTCNATTGLCECAASTECTAAGVSTCNTASHACECADSADCTTEGKDTCVAGGCGCSDASACPASLFKNATPVCE